MPEEDDDGAQRPGRISPKLAMGRRLQDLIARRETTATAVANRTRIDPTRIADIIAGKEAVGTTAEIAAMVDALQLDDAMRREVRTLHRPALFGPALERMRLRRGFSQTDLARVAKVNPLHLHRIERGVRGPPSEPVLERLLEALKLGQRSRYKLLMLAGVEEPDSYLLPSREDSDYVDHRNSIVESLCYDLSHARPSTDHAISGVVLRLPSEKASTVQADVAESGLACAFRQFLESTMADETSLEGRRARIVEFADGHEHGHALANVILTLLARGARVSHIVQVPRPHAVWALDYITQALRYLDQPGSYDLRLRHLTRPQGTILPSFLSLDQAGAIQYLPGPRRGDSRQIVYREVDLGSGPPDRSVRLPGNGEAHAVLIAHFDDNFASLPACLTIYPDAWDGIVAFDRDTAEAAAQATGDSCILGDLGRTHCPPSIWDYELDRLAKIHASTAAGIADLRAIWRESWAKLPELLRRDDRRDLYPDRALEEFLVTRRPDIRKPSLLQMADFLDHYSRFRLGFCTDKYYSLPATYHVCMPHVFMKSAPTDRRGIVRLRIADKYVARAFCDHFRSLWQRLDPQARRRQSVVRHLRKWARDLA